MQRNAIKDAKTRRSKLIRYVPDVSRSLFGLLDGMRQRRQAFESGQVLDSPHKKLRLDPTASSQIIQKLDENQITEDTIHASLVESIDSETPNTLDLAVSNDTTDVITKATIAAASITAVPLYIIPLFNFDDATHDIVHPLFTFRPIIPFTNASTEH
jgi:DNA topoisomerase VI subunit B